MKKKLRNIWFLLLINAVQVGCLQAGMPIFGGGGSSNNGPAFTSNNSSSTGAPITASLPVTPLNYGLQSEDWCNLLMPVMEVYANSDLTCWYQGGHGVPLSDSQLPQLFQHGIKTAAISPDKRTDVIPPYAISSKDSIDPSFFLRNQSNPYTGAGWDATSDLDSAALENIIQSGFANPIANYMSAFVENFAGRAAVGISVLQQGTFFAQPDEQAVVSSFYNQALEIFQKARYSRLMYQFPVNLGKQINQLTGPSGQEAVSIGQPPFVLPNNAADLNSLTGDNFTFTPANNSATASSFLNPLYAFCGVIVISDTSTNLVQVNGNLDSAILSHPEFIVRPSKKAPQGIPYAPVFFLPAVYGTTNNLVYNSYAPVDQSANDYSASSSLGVSLVNRKVSFNSAQINEAGEELGKVVISCTVSSQGVHSSDPLGIYWSYALSSNSASASPGTTPSSEQYGLIFNSTDLENFFTSPTQWAIVMKLRYTAGGVAPSVLGLVKLNPFDFPLNFTIDSMNSVLGIPSESLAAAGQDDDGIAVESSAPTFFSQKDVWNGIYQLYNSAFPESYHQQLSNYSNGLSSYSFSYMVLQGLLNGYLTTNTYSAFFNTGTWPNVTDVSPEYATYYGRPISPTSLYIDQVFPTPLLSDWLGTNSPLDWLYLRALLAARSVLQSIYCPYDALVVPPSCAYADTGKAWTPLLKIEDTLVSILEYAFMHPEQSLVISLPSDSSPNKRLIVGQNYDSQTSMPSNSYQWLLGAGGMVDVAAPGL